MKTSLLASFVLLGVILAQVYAQCGSGSLVDGRCSCISGQAPSSSAQADCTVQAAGTCSMEVLSPLASITNEHVQIDDVRFYSDMLVLTLSAPLVTNRTSSWIQFISSDDSVCKYPGPYWVKTIANCRDTYTLALPWSLHPTCNFLKTETDDLVKYNSTVAVTSAERVGMLLDEDVNRNITTNVNLGIQFQKRIELGSDILVFSTVGVEAALTEQRYDHDNAIGVLTFQTVAQWPFKLENPPVITLPSGFPAQTPTVSLVSEDCSPLGPNFCTQFWRLNFQVSDCYLTGQYRLAFTVGCSNSSVCAIDSASNSTVIVANVVSENFCEVYSADVEFTGTLTPYGDAAFVTPRAYFIVNTTAHFQAMVSSPNATIVDCNITDIVIVDGSLNTVIYTQSAAYGLGAAAQITTERGTQTAGAHFRLLSTFINIPDIYSKVFTIKATVKVAYLNSESKREVRTLSIGTGYSKTRLASSFQAGRAEDSTPRPDANTPTPKADDTPTYVTKNSTLSPAFIGLTVVCVALVVVIVGALIAIRRRYNNRYSRASL